MITCGVCGGGAATWNRNVISCVNHRNKGTCDNALTIQREDLEALVLDGLEKHLMDPELTTVFCEHYTKTMNRLVAEHNAGLEADRSELARIERDMDKLIKAILDGVPGARVKDQIQALEDRKAVLEHECDSGKEMPVSLHPNLSAYYREQIRQLRLALQDEGKRPQAAEAIRALIDKIELVPTRLEDGTEVLAVDLHGKLAEILTMALKSPKPLKDGDAVVECTELVAGACNQLCALFSTERLRPTELVHLTRIH
ncbi:MAG: zinc ribbon domain-containing protein [Pseudomonadota bacterium]